VCATAVCVCVRAHWLSETSPVDEQSQP
jgi:hypothetical protein